LLIEFTGAAHGTKNGFFSGCGVKIVGQHQPRKNLKRSNTSIKVNNIIDFNEGEIKI